MSLFDVLPTDLFKPLASPSRVFYADLLLSLHDKTFSLAADAPRRSDVIGEVQSFLLRWEQTNGAVSEISTDVSGLTSMEDRARSIYQRLIDTSWLLEHKDGYIKRVDMDPDASSLLHVLSGIERGESRTYGGAVIGVLSLLQSAAMNPADFSENIRNALRGSFDFMQHMRTVSVSLRKIEERIVRQDNLRDVFRHFFEDFVQRHLISDFKTLHTKDNPFRFRAKIIHQAQLISSNALVTYSLGEGYAKEGRANNASEGELQVLRDLSEIIRVFDSTEGHLASIDATVARIERRILNTARFMDRITGKSDARIVDAIKKIAAANAGDSGISIGTGLIHRGLPVGPAHIPTPRRERPQVAESSVREIKVDPALEWLKEAKTTYVRRTRVTHESLSSYIERTLSDSSQIQGSQITITSVDDFVAFQRLREIPTMFDGALARRYEIEFLDTRLRNSWIECQDFVLRKKKGQRHAA